MGRDTVATGFRRPLAGHMKKPVETNRNQSHTKKKDHCSRSTLSTSQEFPHDQFVGDFPSTRRHDETARLRDSGKAPASRSVPHWPRSSCSTDTPGCARSFLFAECWTSQNTQRICVNLGFCLVPSVTVLPSGTCVTGHSCITSQAPSSPSGLQDTGCFFFIPELIF